MHTNIRNSDREARNDKILPSATPTITPTPDPTVTPTSTPGGYISGGNVTSGSDTVNPVRTGDDTPIALYVGLLAAAACVVICAVVIVKRRKKN